MNLLADEVHKTNPNMYNLNASEIMFAQRREERRTELLFQLCLRLQTFISFLVSPGLERERSDEAVPLSNIRCIIHFNSENKYLPFLTSGGESKWGGGRERANAHADCGPWCDTVRVEARFSPTRRSSRWCSRYERDIMHVVERNIPLRLTSALSCQPARPLPPRSNHAPS